MPYSALREVKGINKKDTSICHGFDGIRPAEIHAQFYKATISFCDYKGLPVRRLNLHSFPGAIAWRHPET